MVKLQLNHLIMENDHYEKGGYMVKLQLNHFIVTVLLGQGCSPFDPDRPLLWHGGWKPEYKGFACKTTTIKRGVHG